MTIPPISFTKNDLETTIGDRFLKVLRSVPTEHPAYQDASGIVSYRALADASMNLAHRLSKELPVQGDFEQSMIALLLDPDWREMQALLGVALSGHYYLSLDSAQDPAQFHPYFGYPQMRGIVTVSKYKQAAQSLLKEHPGLFLIVLDELASEQHDPLTFPKPPIHFRSDHAVYFTSGSTGAPKGIMRTHAAGLITSYFAAELLGLQPSDRITLTMPLSLGMSVTPSLGALLNGATICRNLTAMGNPAAYRQWLIDEQITIARASAGFLRGLLSLPVDDLPIASLRMIDTGGESFSRGEVEQLLEMMPDGGMLNVRLASNEAGNYGMFSVRKGDQWEGERNPAGKIPPLTEVFVVDEDRNPLPVGSMGELAVCSRFLSSGYLNDPEQTRARFVVDEHDPALQTYYTGDMGQIDEAGMVTFMGRIDNRVKVRGYTIELDAVDIALRSLPQVKDAAVIVQPLPSGNKRLVGYLVMNEGCELVVSEIAAELKKRVPHYMVPSVLLETPSLPQTATEKIDRKRLPMPELARPALAVAYRAPETSLEKTLADSWSKLLDIDQIGVDDGFFELGGDSLLSMQMVLEAESILGINIPPEFFRHPTIAKLVQLKAFSQEEPDDIDSQSSPVEPQPTDSGKLSKLANKITKSRNWHHSLLIKLRKSFENRFLAMEYQEGIQWLLAWSQKASRQQAFYQFEQQTFQRFLSGVSIDDPQAAFSLALAGNIWKDYTPKRGVDGVSFADSPYRFWQTFAEKLHGFRPSEANSLVSVRGYDHLLRSYQAGNGVIMLSYHSTFAKLPPYLVQRWLGYDSIAVISPRLSVRRTMGTTIRNLPAENSILTNEMEHARHGAYAMLNGYRELAEGKLVRAYVDNGFSSRGEWPMQVCGVGYQVRAGWADLAVETGAAVVPLMTYFDQEGVIHLDFEEAMPIDSAATTKAEKTLSLVTQLGDFLTKVYTDHPESLSWEIMKNHFALYEPEK